MLLEMTRAAGVLSLCFCLVGCGSSDEGEDTGASSGQAEESSCATGDYDVIAVGLSKEGDAGLSAILISADPAPPLIGENTWRLRFERDGEDLTGASATLDCGMVGHTHGCPSIPAVTEGADGEYTTDPFTLNMPGIWEIYLTVGGVGDAGWSDMATFRVCIPAS